MVRSVVRIAPNQYVIDSPDAVKVIYGHGAAFKKSDFYFAASNPESHVSDLFSDRDPKTHAQLRRKIASLYSMTNLLKIDAWMHECGNILVERFKELSRLLNSLMKHLSRSGIAEFFKLSAAQVHAGKEGKIPEREGFLTRMLQMHQQNESNMSFLDMMLVCVINLGAGSDNTSIGLTGTMWGLISNPEAMAKVYNYTYGLDVWLTTRKSLQLRAEIDERTAAGDLSASSPIPYQVARCMPYLQAVIKEGLRLEGSPGIPLPRVVPQCGAEIAGHFFPGGTVVGVNAYVLHRNKDIFGHDAEDFNPDRWLGDKEVVSRMDQHFLAVCHLSKRLTTTS
ncbi:hypothetical protein SLS55_010298 [Diplodia seriata]|uniref:Cytochrome p450 n=1 Tax=Diplodia seriata TaxID=420778 RepID=A0ABR3BY57_9PEZI